MINVLSLTEKRGFQDFLNNFNDKNTRYYKIFRKSNQGYISANRKYEY